MRARTPTDEQAAAGRSFQRGHEIAILEAMNAGLPLVVTDVGGNRDLAETNTVCGRVVPYGDTEGFARAILEIMEDGALSERLGAAAGRKIDEEFDLNKLAWDVFRAYQ